MSAKNVLTALAACRGIVTCRLLAPDEKKAIRKMEKPENTGVAQALSRQFTIVAVHDSSLRKPASPTVLLEHEGRVIGRENVKTGKFELDAGADGAKGTYIFPPVPFPELECVAFNVVSSSPSRKVHGYLSGLLGTLDRELATLLIGFDTEPKH